MDEKVKDVQEALFICGFYPGDVDGIMGPNTKNAIKQFQETCGLDPDGIAGPMTRSMLVTKLTEASARITVLMGKLAG
jgi:peptidoglycan hydrolase-like protein with peptidoglycan-binding domain